MAQYYCLVTCTLKLVSCYNAPIKLSQLRIPGAGGGLVQFRRRREKKLRLPI